MRLIFHPVGAENVILSAELRRRASIPDVVPPRYGTTPVEPVLPTVGFCISAARSSVKSSSSLNMFVQVTRTDDVFDTHTLKNSTGNTRDPDALAERLTPAGARERMQSGWY
jgi:hypothetical protein